ncbi:tumor protein p63-regulated gene 1-like protein isoform X1 [Copidosoma floridanum]|uniref:tumor protein p63-regulated gene 1-like protein isoform X1 n=1 Tax=Copidosoma floridanum TaxID=29053 RepID=UPI0006C986E4|nr:tumor protein p63-regulated gene 1-like protein isoform X1 [Copidosoma floridanum]XP_014214253.1 tumor protein p63-regulated gene 1-like protein isoform X1 [Copidosoma floridanum]
MDDTFLQDEGPNFDRATLEIKSENTFLESQNVRDGKETSTERTLPGPGVPLAGVPGIPYARIDCHTFFSDRNEVVEKALADCKRDLLTSTEEEEFVGAWFLTEISIWDTEKERLVLLTKESLYWVKYDLISLKIIEYHRISLTDVDTLVAGELVYPPTSILPRLNGLAEGVSTILHNAIRQEWSSITSLSSTAHFEPRGRNMFGVRLMWNKGESLSLDQRWNPFTRNIPWLTFTSHPLYWHKGSDSNKAKYDVQALHLALKNLLSTSCQILDNPIIIENYVGIGSLVHNRTGLGFFKIRGKFSF